MANAYLQLIAYMCVATSLAACGDAMRADANMRDARAIRIVGSSTVYPFSTKVAQEFRNKTGHSVIVEATGSGGGHKLFCAGIGPNTPDVTNSSRARKPSEEKLCLQNGVTNVIEMKIGYDGIVIANSIDASSLNLDLATLYLGLAKRVPTSDTDCTLIDNPYQNWRQIDPALPDFEIEVYGPPPTSGTRDAFVEIAMETGARTVPCIAALSPAAFRDAAHIMREDGRWIDSGENDNALVQTLVNAPSALGVFGYSFLSQNIDKIQGAKIGGITPTLENISSESYPVARSLYVYIKGDKFPITPGLRDFALELLSDEAAGPAGYLEDIGLVPLPVSQRQNIRKDVLTAFVETQ